MWGGRRPQLTNIFPGYAGEIPDPLSAAWEDGSATRSGEAEGRLGTSPHLQGQLRNRDTCQLGMLQRCKGKGEVFRMKSHKGIARLAVLLPHERIEKLR